MSYTPFPSLFKAHFGPSLTSDSPFNLCPFCMGPSFFENIHVLSGMTRCSRLIFCSCPSSGNQPLLQGVLIHFNGKWYLESKIWAVDVLIPIEMLLLPGRAKEYMFLCKHTHTQIHSLPSDTICQAATPQHSEEFPLTLIRL